VSIMYTFNAKNANAPSTHHTQYFEMMGDHAIYHDGWMASTKVMRPPWELTGKVSQDPAGYPWELYNLNKDWTQSENVADKYPAKLKELEKLFWTEASKYQVLPLDASVSTRIVAPRPSLSAGRTDFTWIRPVVGTPNGDAPSIIGASFTLTAEVEVPASGGDGMIVTQGGRFGGYGFYILKGRPTFTYNMLDLKRTVWTSPNPLPVGRHSLEFDFTYDGLGLATLAFNNTSGIGQGGTGVLKVDGQEVAREAMPNSIPLIMQWDESFDIGADTGTPVSNDYSVPFNFTGKLDKLTLHIERPKLTPADEQKLKEMERNKQAEE